MDFEEFQFYVRSVDFGKELPDAIYLHKSSIEYIPHELKKLIQGIAVALNIADSHWDLIKLFKRNFKLSYLSYPKFLDYPYPTLQQSNTVDLAKKTNRIASYANSENPPILHRRELFLHPSDTHVADFAEYTAEGEGLDLYNNTRIIGTLQGWNRVIKRSGHMLNDAGHIVPLKFKCSAEASDDSQTGIHRHKTAISRDKLSVPMFTLARSGYLDGDYTVLDYGCGKGDDIRELDAHEIDCIGWDPVHRPDIEVEMCDIVNLGYVINVIEEINERRETLLNAFSLSRKIIAISAMLGNENIVAKFRPYKDGVITKAKTFQKYYYQAELKEFIESTLSTEAIAAGPGLFFVFKDKVEEQSYLSERQRTRLNWKQISKRIVKTKTKKVSRSKIEQNESLLNDFWCCCLELGRPAGNDEFEHSEQLRHLFGSHAAALDICQSYFEKVDFIKSEKVRRDDLLVYLALDHFGKRQAYNRMPESLRRDIKYHFGKYQAARDEAREILFSISEPQLIHDCCRSAESSLPAAVLTEDHNLVFEKKLLNLCPAPLRVYVGCALQLYGDLESIDLIKVHIQSGKVTLMVYEGYDTNPIPLLRERIKIKMREQDIDFFDYVCGYRPQPLLLKSRFMSEENPNYQIQVEFDQRLLNVIGIDLIDEHVSAERLEFLLESNQIKLEGYSIITN